MSKYERSRVQTPKGNSSKALMTFQEVNIANSNYSFKIILNNLTRVNFTEKQVSSVSSPFYTTQNPPESNLLIPWGRGRVALLQLEKVVTPLPEIQFYTDDDATSFWLRRCETSAGRRSSATRRRTSARRGWAGCARISGICSSIRRLREGPRYWLTACTQCRLWLWMMSHFSTWLDQER